MRVMICGIDGYLGWSLAIYLTEAGYDVCGIDNCNRRLLVSSVGADSAFPLPSLVNRKKFFKRNFDKDLNAQMIDLRDYEQVMKFVQVNEPDAVVHLAEMPSAPYSMIGPKECMGSFSANVAGHLSLLWVLREFPHIHLLKLGTLGEYGTPNMPIAEGKFSVTYKGHTDMIHPGRSPVSFYHSSKVADSVNTELACKIWNIKATDVMQGIVYGAGLPAMDEDPNLRTRFDFDAVFGTVVNRFCAQAVLGLPLLLYGGGKQRRALLALQDSMRCLKLLLDHPAKPGEYRVVNQFSASHTVEELALAVKDAAEEHNLCAMLNVVPNPRVEAQEHFYEPECAILKDLGYIPSGSMDVLLGHTIDKLLPLRVRLRKLAPSIEPKVMWRQ